MAKRRNTAMPHEPSDQEKLGWQIESLARDMTLQHPRVKKIEETIKAKLEKTAETARKTSPATSKPVTTPKKAR